MQTDTDANIDVILNEIKHIRIDVGKIQKDIECIEKGLDTATVHRGSIDARTSRIEEIVLDHRERIKLIESILPPMQSAYRILLFVGSAFGVSIIALIWAIVTHQVSIGF